MTRKRNWLTPKQVDYKRRRTATKTANLTLTLRILNLWQTESRALTDNVLETKPETQLREKLNNNTNTIQGSYMSQNHKKK